MKLLLTCFILSITINCSYGQEESAATQEEETEAITINGSVDVYFRKNLGADFDFAPGTSFANLPGFSLGMANLVLAHETKKTGIVLDLVFGPRGEDATFLSEELRPGGISKIVNQLYAYWNITNSVKATIGNFNTFLGYEVISPAANFNYSTSYMFSYGPFSHSGLKLDFDLGGNFSLMTGVFNPTDYTEFNPLNSYMGGVQLGYENDGLGIWINSLFSDEFYQVDITAGFELTDKFYIGFNATTAQDAFYGVATYVQLATSDNLKIGTRIEYFKDQGVDVEMIGDGDSVVDVTFSAEYRIGNLKLIPEFRVDLFSAENSVPNGTEFGKTLNSLVLAAVYEF